MNDAAGDRGTRVGRIVEPLLGTLLAGCGVAILMLEPPTNGQAWLVAALMLLVGLQAIVVGRTGRRSWLGRIGPLP